MQLLLLACHTPMLIALFFFKVTMLALKNEGLLHGAEISGAEGTKACRCIRMYDASNSTFTKTWSQNAFLVKTNLLHID